MSINQVFVVGNVVTQPVMDFVGPSQRPKCTFRFAQTERRPDSEGNWQDGKTLFINVTCWRSVAENAYASVHKGDALLVVGRLMFDEWEKDGQRRSRHELDATHLGPDLSRQIVMIRKARRYTPDATAPSDGSTYGDGSDGLSDADLATLEQLEALDAASEGDELDAIETALPTPV